MILPATHRWRNNAKQIAALKIQAKKITSRDQGSFVSYSESEQYPSPQSKERGASCWSRISYGPNRVNLKDPKPTPNELVVRMVETNQCRRTTSLTHWMIKDVGKSEAVVPQHRWVIWTYFLDIDLT